MRNSSQQSEEELYQAILTLETPEECRQFFDDLCTVQEIRAMTQRFEVASRLRHGEKYLDIAQKTGASTATISRVNRSLLYGAGGYDLTFRRMEAEKETDPKEE